ncbi:MAG: DUF4870 domain-containing protein [Rhodospirillaceae bacterium]|nr:DUF4870 domain-containing protein [Rhodospirillaceae bacterium]
MTKSPASPPPASALDERRWSIVLHISALAGMVVPLGNVIGPLVVWLIKKPESALVDRHGKAALNFQISSTIYFIAMGLLVIVFIGLPLLVVYSIFWFVMVILATIRAADNEDPGYLLSIAFVK